MDYFFSFNKIDYVKRKKDGSCILCSIGKEDDKDNLKVLETKYFIQCVNLYPYNPGHLMIFPKRHVEDLREFNKKEQDEFWEIKKHSLNALDNLYQPNAYNVGFNIHLEAGASIKHIHLHIIPRYPNEIGVAELIGGARVLVEDPKITKEKLIKYYKDYPLSIR